MRIKDIVVNFVPHHCQDYDTVGNYGEFKDETWFNVSLMKDWRHMMLVLVHELVEYTLVKWRGIDLKKIDAFDIKFEKKRKKGNTDEPGDDPKCLYFREHQFATKLERMLARELGVKWEKYDRAVNEL